MQQGSSKNKKRDALLAAISIIFSAVVMLWVAMTDMERAYLYGSIVIIALILIPFYISFEKSQPYARTIVLIAILVTIAVISRATFFWVPQFKPIIAIIIIGGIATGPQAGFVIGSMSAFVSNFLFGQGPWTVFQMIAWGLIGLVAAILFVPEALLTERAGKKAARMHKVLLLVYAVVACFVIHGGITDLWTAMSISDRPTLGTLLTVYGAGLIPDAVLATATVIFLVLLTEPMLKKIKRVQQKYGM